MSKPEIYCSIDIEANGPGPGVHSMLSFGTAAFSSSDYKMISTFSANLKTLPGSVEDSETMAWWNRDHKNKEAYDKTRVNQEEPVDAMKRYVEWLNALPGQPVCVAYPAGYDFSFIYYYLIRFAGTSPYGFSAVDLKSYAMAMLKTNFKQTTKRNFPKRWFSKSPHTHEALQDAIEQGELFCNILKENLKK